MTKHRRAAEAESGGSEFRTHWPDIELDSVPPPETATKIARQVREAILPPEQTLEPIEDIGLLGKLGQFELTQKTITAAQHDVQGWIFARPRRSFLIEVDNEPPGGWETVPERLREEVGHHRFRFIGCHEIAHSFFFSRQTDTPEQLLPHSSEEEEFCERFAEALLVPPEVVAETARTPEGVVELHRRFDVSLKCAAKALQRIHGPDFFVGLVLNAERVLDEPLDTYVQWCEPWDYIREEWQRGALLKEAVLSGAASKTARHYRSGRRLRADAAYWSEYGQAIVTAQPTRKT